MPRNASKSLVLLACALALASVARADKIVLKNGRKIVASNVVEDGNMVRYETPAGQLAIPKSIVDHIERGLPPVLDSPAAKAARLNLEPPELPSTGNDSEIDKNAVHDGNVDRGYIARLEVEARTGEKPAAQAAARASYAAAQFEIFKGDLERAQADTRRALSYAPEQPELLMNMAYLYLRQSKFKESLEYLQKAKKVSPEDPDIY